LIAGVLLGDIVGGQRARTTAWWVVSATAVTAAGSWLVMAVALPAGPEWDTLRWLNLSIVVLYVGGMWVLDVERLWWLKAVIDLDGSRRTAAELATARERLRVADDLHDILGHALEVVAFKSELAARLQDVDPARARAEMEEVQRVARESLSEVRALVRDTRSTDLVDELAGARAVLASAGGRARVRGDPTTLGPTARNVLGRVLREAMTNVLRHAQPSHCTIEIEVDRDGARLEVVNDGALPPGTARARAWPRSTATCASTPAARRRAHRRRPVPRRRPHPGGRPMIRLVLADDESLTRGAVGALLGLEADLEIVGRGRHRRRGRGAVQRHRPDVAVLDVEMPGRDGARWRSGWPSTPPARAASSSPATPGPACSGARCRPGPPGSSRRAPRVGPGRRDPPRPRRGTLRRPRARDDGPDDRGVPAHRARAGGAAPRRRLRHGGRHRPPGAPVAGHGAELPVLGHEQAGRRHPAGRGRAGPRPRVAVTVPRSGARR
jgi:hypothetical protein